MKKKIVAAALACILCIGVGIGGTLAWLSAETQVVTNTFTVGDINIELKEHVYDPAANNGAGALTTALTTTGNSNYKFVPGDELPKDPFVTVKADSEACYLFIEAIAANNSRDDLNGDIISWSVDTTIWTPLNGVANVWYKQLGATTTDTDYSILTGDEVSVNENVTKLMVEEINESQPTLTFQAYAVQSDNIADAAAAWAIANS